MNNYKYIIDLVDLDHFLSKKKSCDHTFKNTLKWAAKNNLPDEAIEELANELDVHCDCELAEIIGDAGDVFEIKLDKSSPPNSHKWMIPSDYLFPSLDKTYQQLIVSPDPSMTVFKCYTTADEILIPAPMGYKPPKKMRKITHFFMGILSGLPSEVGLIKQCPPMTAPEFLEEVKRHQLKGFEDFDLLIASFYLERCARMSIGKGAGVDFIDELGDFGSFTTIRFGRRLL